MALFLADSVGLRRQHDPLLFTAARVDTLGDSEFRVRFLSILFGVLTIPAVYFLARRLFDRATGLIASALLSVHSFHIHWSQQARTYSLLPFLLVVAIWFLAGAVESEQGSAWIAFSVTAALSVYAQIFGLLALAAQAVSIAFPRPFRIRFRTLASSPFVFGLLCAPMAAFLMVHVLLHHADQLNWIPPTKLGDFIEFCRCSPARAEYC